MEKNYSTSVHVVPAPLESGLVMLMGMGWGGEEALVMSPLPKQAWAALVGLRPCPHL